MRLIYVSKVWQHCEESRNKLHSSAVRRAQSSAASLVLISVILLCCPVEHQDELLPNLIFFFLLSCPSLLLTTDFTSAISQTHNTNFLLLPLPVRISCLVLLRCSSIPHNYSLSPQQYPMTSSKFYANLNSYAYLTLQWQDFKNRTKNLTKYV